MSAQEIVEQIKGLPAEERQEVVKMVQEFEVEAAKTAGRTKPDWRAIMTKIFDEHDELFRKLAQ